MIKRIMHVKCLAIRILTHTKCGWTCSKHLVFNVFVDTIILIALHANLKQLCFEIRSLTKEDKRIEK